MKLIIDIPEDVYKRTKFYHEFRDLNDCVITLKAIDNAIPLEDIKAEIEDLCNEPAKYIPNYDAYKKCWEIIDKHIGGGK